jgi:hypothetical protein
MAAKQAAAAAGGAGASAGTESQAEEFLGLLDPGGPVGLYPIVCHFSVQLNHFIPGFLSYSVAVFLK